MEQNNFNNIENILRKLSELGEYLEKLNAKINWELFRPIINDVFNENDKTPPYDYILMFKILILQISYDLPDNKIVFLINDSLSCQRFLGVINSSIPKVENIKSFRENLINKNVYEQLLKVYNEQLGGEDILKKEDGIINMNLDDMHNRIKEIIK